MPHPTSDPKSVLITGCSSGIGQCVAHGLKERGYRVFATARKAEDVARLQAFAEQEFTRRGITRAEDAVHAVSAGADAINVASGLEFWTTADIDGWLLEADLTLLDPVNETDGPNKGNLLARRPEQTFRLDLDRRIGDVGVGGTLFVAGRRFDDNANAVRLDGFTLLGLRAEYFFSERLRVQAEVSNLLDEEWVPSADRKAIPAPGRSVGLRLTWRGR